MMLVTCSTGAQAPRRLGLCQGLVRSRRQPARPLSRECFAVADAQSGGAASRCSGRWQCRWPRHAADELCSARLFSRRPPGQLWPAGLAPQKSPAAPQNDMHYAYFPAAGRLAVKVTATSVSYDTAATRSPASPSSQSSGGGVVFMHRHRQASALPASGERHSSPHGHSCQAAQLSPQSHRALHCRSIQLCTIETRRPAKASKTDVFAHPGASREAHAERHPHRRTSSQPKRPSCSSRL